MIRFAIYPRLVRSVNDADLHYVGARRLMDLYGVHPSECVVIDEERPETSRGLTDEYLRRLLHLSPSYQGGAYWRVSDAERLQYPLPAVPTAIEVRGDVDRETIIDRIFWFTRKATTP